MILDRLYSIFSFFLHFDQVLGNVIREYGVWTHGLIFLIIFCETGLIITPFLPGDSLLFAAGAFASRGSMNIGALLLLCFTAAVIGDTVNYTVGRRLGLRAFEAVEGRILKRAHLEKAERFYLRYGGRAIILSRFMPIIRTLAPFLAGVSRMPYAEFIRYNIAGGAIWVTLFLVAGYFFGAIPIVQRNFSLVIIAIIAISLAPLVREVVLARFAHKKT
jgi:membrane-associated protein